ncbi:PKD domain-containing protein [Flavobacterium sp. DSR3-2]|uniref:PKD domain-containing protein n=1 Tax=Flavobacterium sp. DSR3-2 TaxID=2804634 RepID=UPI003CF7CF31
MILKQTTTSKLSCFLLLVSLSILSCDDNIREVSIYNKGQLEASSTNTSIKATETVSYQDLSTKVQSRKWTFQGGTPSASTDANVVVTYATGGSYFATLEIKYVDNQIEKKTFAVEVEAALVPVVPATEKLGIYTEDVAITKTAATVAWVSANQFVIANNTSGGYEGAFKSFSLPDTAPAAESKWVMAILSLVTSTDISSYTYINLAVKTTSTGKIRFRMKDAANTGYVEIDANNTVYGLKRDGNWNMVQIPLANYKTQNPALDLTKIKDILVLRSVDGEDVRTLNNYTFSIDNVFLSK